MQAPVQAKIPWNQPDALNPVLANWSQRAKVHWQLVRLAVRGITTDKSLYATNYSPGLLGLGTAAVGWQPLVNPDGGD